MRIFTKNFYNLAFNFKIYTIAYYERPWMHNLQQLISREHNFSSLTVRDTLRRHLGKDRITGRTLTAFPHHLSHAAAGFQTSPFEEAAVVVIDAVLFDLMTGIKTKTFERTGVRVMPDALDASNA